LDASRAAAAQAHLDLAAIDRALDAIRAKAPSGIFELWSAFNDQVGAAESAALRRPLIELRSRFQDVAITAEIERIAKVFSQSPDAGWRAWLSFVAEALSLFCLRFGTRLCEHPFPFPQSKQQEVESLKRLAKNMLQSRWPETYDTLAFLSEQDFIPA